MKILAIAIFVPLTHLLPVPAPSPAVTAAAAEVETIAAAVGTPTVIAPHPVYAGYCMPREWRPSGVAAGGRMENLHHQFRKAVVTAGLEEVSFHTLRHTFASRIVSASGGLVEARELLGHRDYQVTLRYVHLTNLQLRNAVKKIG